MKIAQSALRFMKPAELRMHEESELLYRNLGEFFLLWADVETELYNSLIYYSRVTDDVGRAIFSGCRARTMIDFIKNIAHNTNMEMIRADDHDYLFAQINTINTTRDKLAHFASASNFSVSHQTLQRTVSNFRRSGKKKNEFHMGINSEIVEAMCDDLRRIQYRLGLHYRKNAPTKLGEDIHHPELKTWRYKPASQSNLKSKSQKAPQSPQRQQRPSPAK